MPGYDRFRFGDILVDEGRNRIYITGGDGTEDLVVTDLDGGNLRTIWIGMGAAGMTLSPDGTKLYVAAGERDYLVIVDTATYATSSYWVGTPYGEYTCPRDVAVAAGQLWFSWGCDLLQPHRGPRRLWG
jgi:DNA-binding beta-propeller fold protein YncE